MRNWLTDFRFGCFKYNPITAYSDAGTTPMTNFGIPGLNIGGQPDTDGLSGFLFTSNGGNGFNGALGNPGGGTYAFGNGLDAARCNCPLTEREHELQFVNNWTRLKANHTIKFGADIRYATNLRVPSDQSRSGLLYFDRHEYRRWSANGRLAHRHHAAWGCDPVPALRQYHQ